MARKAADIIKDGEKTRFTSDNQPTNPGRKKKSRAWKDVLADMMPEDGYLTFDKAQVMAEDGKGNWKPTGELVEKVRVKMATQEMIVLAAIKQAMKGKTDAIKMIWERMDGRPTQPLGNDPDNPLTKISFKD